MNNLQKFIRNQKIKFLIRKLTRLIYSDTLPISTETNREDFISKFANKNDKLNLLTTYLAIQCITRDISYINFYEPVSKLAIHEIQTELDNLTKHSTVKELSKAYNEVLNSSLSLNSTKAYRYLRLTSLYLANGREAYKENPYSFEGARYIREKNNKRPLSLKEQKACKESASEIAKLGIQVKEAEDKYDAAVSELAAQAALDKMIKEVEEKEKIHGKRSPDEIREEREAIIKKLKEKLNSDNKNL